MGSFRSLASPRSLRVLLPVGLLLAGWSGWRMYDEGRLLGRAVEAGAEVLAVTVEDDSAGTGTSRERKWRPVVRYRYLQDGRWLESDVVTPFDSSGSRSWAEELAGRFEPGRTTRAWVDPENPQRAFLVPIRSWKPPVGLALGGAIALGAAWGLLRRRRGRGADAAAGRAKG